MMTDYERFGDYQPRGNRGMGYALTFLFIGIGVGALTGLLMAPESGRRMRRHLRRHYEDALDRMGDLGDHSREMWHRGSGWASSKVEPIGKFARRAGR